MELIDEYGGTIVAVGIGTILGVSVLGLMLYYGDDADIGIAKKIRDGLGG